MMLPNKLKERCEALCELCATDEAVNAYAVSPKNHDAIENEVAICSNCLSILEGKDPGNHWQCLAGSIWNSEPAVQALSYRILYGVKDQSWASEIIESVEPDEAVINWAISVYEKKAIHTDSNGAELLSGDTVVLTQGLNVKGANFMAPKGTIVRKIRLVPDNTDQIEGKINEQTIVILTKYVRKG
ncbi:MAG: PhnA domain-containing protein [Sediminibacterium sp.]